MKSIFAALILPPLLFSCSNLRRTLIYSSMAGGIAGAATGWWSPPTKGAARST